MTPFGTTADGRDVHAVEIGGADLTARILTYGAVLQDVRLSGVGHPLTLGSPELAAYEGPLESFGSLMGPVVNRIRDARAVIDGVEHRFTPNFTDADGAGHLLHSGTQATHHQVWEVVARRDDVVSLSLTLQDGFGGFPGNRRIFAHYRVAGTKLTLEVTADSDRTTLFCLANHSYWALDGRASFAGHRLTVPAGRMLEQGPGLMPTGRVVHVEGTDYDARAGLTLAGDDSQFFDLNYCATDGDRAEHMVARLEGKTVAMTLSSTAPGLQVYDCGTIDGAGFATHHGAPYGTYSALALEAQRWPGATTHAGFPSIEYAPGQRFHQRTSWTFETL